MAYRPLRAAALSLLLAGGAVFAAPPPPETVESRVTRLEQRLDSRALADLLMRLETLQQEVQQLRGQVEEQSHAIEGLKRRQRDLYLDADRRLTAMEKRTSTPPQAGEPADAAEGPGAEPPASAEERAAYQRAFDLLRDLRYEQATAAFRAFVKQYPDGRYGHIAQYWLGEANYAQRLFKQAIADYRRLVDGYPKSPKVAEAMLKIGHCHDELGERPAAIRALNELIQRYPESTEAGQARALLQQWKEEG